MPCTCILETATIGVDKLKCKIEKVYSSIQKSLHSLFPIVNQKGIFEDKENMAPWLVQNIIFQISGCHVTSKKKVKHIYDDTKRIYGGQKLMR